MYKNILVPVDLAHKETASAMIEDALALAAEDAKMTLLYVMPEIPGIVAAHLPAGTADEAKARAEAQLRQLAEDNGAPSNVEALTSVGPPYHNILETAASDKVDLIVIASHQPELSDYLLGSVAAKVVRHAPCSVHVIR